MLISGCGWGGRVSDFDCALIWVANFCLNASNSMDRI